MGLKYAVMLRPTAAVHQLFNIPTARTKTSLKENITYDPLSLNLGLNACPIWEVWHYTVHKATQRTDKTRLLCTRMSFVGVQQ